MDRGRKLGRSGSLLVAGRGHRAMPGELIHAELNVVITDEKLKQKVRKVPPGLTRLPYRGRSARGLGGVRNRPSE